jgi:sulfur carrier protein
MRRGTATSRWPLTCGLTAVYELDSAILARVRSIELVITLNGDPHEVAGPLTVIELLARLGIDPRRVAVEQNLVVLKRAGFAETMVREGDHIEIVNFVGGGS